jgi:rhamnosyltransferase
LYAAEHELTAEIDAMPGVCAIIVTFNPDAQLVANISALASQVAEIVIVDNASRPEGLQIVAEAARQSVVSVIHQTENVGIAAALNIGVGFAVKRDCPWVVTFDQDSSAPAGFVPELLNAWHTCPFHSDVALISPRYRDRYTGKVASYAAAQNSGRVGEVMTTITSGNLVRSDVFAVVGLFEESFFMDCVDHEFCLRLRSKGFRLIEAPEAILEHSLGRMELHAIAGRQFKTFNHSPLRRYYNARNRILVYRRYGGSFPGWVWGDLGNFMREIGGIVIFEQQKIAKLAAICRGLIDGLLGRTGKLSN